MKRHRSTFHLLTIVFVICALGAYVWAEKHPSTNQDQTRRDSKPAATQVEKALEQFDWPVVNEIAWLDIGLPKINSNEKAFLGVHVRDADATLRHHLGLSDGVGLVVEHVTPESAAAESGIKVHDVLHKLDDQILINNGQLVTLIRMHRPGDEVQLTIVRSGKSRHISATLKEGTGQSDVELLQQDWWRTKDASTNLAKVHDMTNPDIQNCAACHVMSGYHPQVRSN